MPITIGDFGITDILVNIQKIIATILIGSRGFFYLAGNFSSIIMPFILLQLDLRFILMNYELILISSVPTNGIISVSDFMSRILRLEDLIILNNQKRKILIPQNPK